MLKKLKALSFSLCLRSLYNNWGHLPKLEKLLPGGKRVVAALFQEMWHDSMSAKRTSVVYFELDLELVHISYGM